MGLFHGTVALKKNPYGKLKSPAQTVGVLGAGLMGGIAKYLLGRHNVPLKDINAARLPVASVRLRATSTSSSAVA